MSADEIIRALGGNPSTGMCRCPAHADKNPSLKVSTGNNGNVLVYCFADCSQDAVIDALKRRGLWHQSRSRRPMRLAPDYEDADMKANQPTPTQPNEVSERERWSRDAAHRIINTALYGP